MPLGRVNIPASCKHAFSHVGLLQVSISLGTLCSIAGITLCWIGLV